MFSIENRTQPYPATFRSTRKSKHIAFRSQASLCTLPHFQSPRLF